ncbi:MAG: NIL domain-containing protein [Anaerolineales bacterium]
MEISKVLRLDYPAAVVNRPVVNYLIRDFGLAVNILQAEVSSEVGWLLVEVRGPEENYARALEYMRGEGLKVTEVPPGPS